MPLITPPETVTVDTGHLYTVVVTVRAAHHRDSDEFHPEVVHAANGLRQSLIIPHGRTTHPGRIGRDQRQPHPGERPATG